MAETTRRRFLRASVAAGAGVWLVRSRVSSAQGLGGQFAVPAQPPCTDTRKATPEVKDLEAFKPNAPERMRIHEGGVAGMIVVFMGSVSGLTCGLIKDARIDVWHADIRGEYDMKGFNNRGAQLTDAKGLYRFESTPPGAAAGLGPHFNVRIQPPGKAPFTTRVFFPWQASTPKDPALPQELIAKIDKQGGQTIATFNFVLNI